MSVANVVVLPSLFEGLPLVAIEVLAAQRPMVATAVDGTPEVVIEGKTGLTVPPQDSHALAAAISRLLRDPAYAARLASAGSEWVKQHFNQESQIRRTEELYLQAREERLRAAAACDRNAEKPGEALGRPL
jgi:glycosyltransferase involved in cell wall biosynthesis